MDPKDLLNNPEQLKTLIQLLQSLLPQEESKEQSSVDDTQLVDKEEIKESTFNTNIKTKNKRSDSPHINKFEKMSEFNMHKDDRVIDEKLSKLPPVARSREFEPVQAICRICGKKEVVSPSLIHDNIARYKCNNCSTQAG